MGGGSSRSEREPPIVTEAKAVTTIPSAPASTAPPWRAASAPRGSGVGSVTTRLLAVLLLLAAGVSSGVAAAVVHLDDLLGQVEVLADVGGGLLVEDELVAVLLGETGD